MDPTNPIIASNSSRHIYISIHSTISFVTCLLKIPTRKNISISLRSIEKLPLPKGSCSCSRTIEKNLCSIFQETPIVFNEFKSKIFFFPLNVGWVNDHVLSINEQVFLNETDEHNCWWKLLYLISKNWNRLKLDVVFNTNTNFTLRLGF